MDRAALDAAREAGVATGGWCPRGRWAEDGRIAEHYPLRETPERDPAQRTARNVRDSDATLVLARGPLSGGTRLTVAKARELGRPCLVLDLALDADPARVLAWLDERRVSVLNVAGPRESGAPGIYAAARELLAALFREAGRAASPAAGEADSSGTDAPSR